MPIYEFYCRKCNTIFNFFSRSINTNKTPSCPACKTVKLKRQVSLFATTAGKKKDDDGGGNALPPIDEAKMEKAMSMFTREANNINEDDPRQAAALMRKLADVAGIRMGKGMEEALDRMEMSNDPESIEHEVEHMLGEEEPFILEGKGGRKEYRSSTKKPRVDDTLYEL